MKIVRWANLGTGSFCEITLFRGLIAALGVLLLLALISFYGLVLRLNQKVHKAFMPCQQFRSLQPSCSRRIE